MDVLLVEDEPLVREAVAEALDAAGLDVAQAASAEAALAAVGLAAGAPAPAAAGPQDPPGTSDMPAPPPPAPPAVLVTDVDLGSAPGGEAALDGFALAAALRRRWPGLGVVVVTGSAASLARCAELRPPERHLLKPVAPEDLVRAVRDLAAPPASASGR